MNHLNLPALEDALEDVEFFEPERTDPFVVELSIVLYDSGVSLRKIQRILGWLGVDRSHIVVWNWLQKFGQRLSATGRQPVADLPDTALLKMGYGVGIRVLDRGKLASFARLVTAFSEC